MLFFGDDSHRGNFKIQLVEANKLDFPNAIILYLALESLDALYLNSITEYMPTHLPTRFRSFSFASLHQYHHKRLEMTHEALDTVNGKTFRFHYMFDKNIRYLF